MYNLRYCDGVVDLFHADQMHFLLVKIPKSPVHITHYSDLNAP